MKTTPSRLILVLGIGLSGLVGGPKTLGAVSFVVTTDTSALVGSGSGPFRIDLQLLDGSGSGDGNNTVTIGGFEFGGGGWIGPDPGSIDLNDGSFLVDSMTPFSPGTYLRFGVTLSTVADAGPTPDQFSFALLDGTGSEIPTMGAADALLTVDIASTSRFIQTYRSDLSRTDFDIPAPSITGYIAAMPEGGAGWVAASVILGLMSSRRR